MSKFTALAIGLLTMLAIAPDSQALTTPNNPATTERPSADLRAQLIIKIGGQQDYHGDSYRRRQWEIQRERAREARRRRWEYFSKRYHRQNEYRIESRDDYHGNSYKDYRNDSNNDYRGDSRYGH
ncbi:hypothetical protein [Chamaesiphon minutus]|uniref:Uncharacterized protein n=1 Tax=Chamaesiphon minutus (strain ATCC 27169 / PCC 6605) TaxID=1173020 RepID=K9UIU4_CHAP6|nr:hypothetical protein [Chamaesiphon minutus]AFY94725.1 hypothetical protein Cha6605_3754 [Chamaesiphon minutus PCC 6605]